METKRTTLIFSADDVLALEAIKVHLKRTTGLKPTLAAAVRWAIHNALSRGERRKLPPAN
jgi:hypothetical protein